MTEHTSKPDDKNETETGSTPTESKTLSTDSNQPVNKNVPINKTPPENSDEGTTWDFDQKQ